MIASLHGTVLTLSLTDAVVECAGVGYRVLATPATLASLRVGEETRLHTELIVREDSQTLYGFSEADERDAFRVLLTAKGVGAKLALAMLAVHTPDALRRAIAAEDVAALKRVPGLGPKGAQRVIIDVGDKLGSPHGESPSASGAADEAAAGGEGGEPNLDVVAALVQLGWNEASAREAVTAVEPGLASSGKAPAVPEILRAALRWLGGGRRG